MKQTLKRIMSCAIMLVCVIAMTACGAAKTEEAAIDETMSSSMITTAEGLTEAIVILSDDEIASYKESGDAFTEQAMEAWESSRDELGEYIGLGTSVVEEVSEGYTVTIPGEFETRNADIVYMFDENGTPTSLAVNPEYTMAENMEKAALNTLMGVGIVFVMLIFLSLVISLFKFIPALEAKMTKKNGADAKAPVETSVPAAAPIEAVQTDDSELIAVIAAAIAAAEGTSTDSFVVRSIKKVNRKKW